MKPTCKQCGSPYHSKMSCKDNPVAVAKAAATKKRMQDKQRLKASTKPIKRPVGASKAKKVKTPTKKSKSRSWYVKELDRVFSLYIRQSKSNEDGMGTCVTCGKYDYWGLLQNGHYYSRGKYPTRWHEDNCHIQCMRCNVMMKGNYTSYALYMFSKYGEDKVMELHKLAHSGEKIPTSAIREKIEEYKQKTIDIA